MELDPSSMSLSTSAYDLYDLTKVSFALKKQWVKHFVNLPIECFFAFYYSQFSWDTILFNCIIAVFFILEIKGMRAVGKKRALQEPKWWKYKVHKFLAKKLKTTYKEGTNFFFLI